MTEVEFFQVVLILLTFAGGWLGGYIYAKDKKENEELTKDQYRGDDKFLINNLSQFDIS